MRRTPKIVEDAVVTLYKQGNSMGRIMEMLASIDYPISVTTVYNILNRRGVATRPNVIPLNLDIKELKRLYYEQHLSLEVIASKFNVCVNTIRNYLDADGTYRPNFVQKDFGLDHGYFKTIDTEAKAYLLGFLLADGNVYYPKSGSRKLRMQLHEKDVSVLEFMRAELRSVNVIQHNTRDGASDHTCTFCVTSDQLVQDLAKYGMVPAKTYELNIPILPEPYMQHMLRGLFDGDGSVIHTEHCKAVDFSGMSHHLIQVQNYLVEHVGVARKQIYTQISEYTDGKYYEDWSHVMWGGRQDYGKILDYLYRNATIYLRRKYATACEIWFNAK